MLARENRWPWWAIVGGPVLLIAVGAVIGRTILRPHQEPPEPVYLPSESITVDVESQTTLDELAVLYDENNDLRIVEGQLRDENGRLLKTVEVLSVETEAAPPPEPEIVTRIIKEACEEDELPEFKARFAGVKFEGLEQGDDSLAFAWSGRIKVWMGTDPDWALVHDQTATGENTLAITSTPPEPHRLPQRYFLSMDYAVLRDTTSAQFDSFVSSFRPDALRIRGGYRLWPLKRRTVEVGVFADSQSAGVSLGLSF